MDNKDERQKKDALNLKEHGQSLSRPGLAHFSFGDGHKRRQQKKSMQRIVLTPNGTGIYDRRMKKEGQKDKKAGAAGNTPADEPAGGECRGQIPDNPRPFDHAGQDRK